MHKVILVFICLLVTWSLFGLSLDGYSGINAENPLYIESYVEGSDEVVHPDVIYFAEAWNGYHYWMVFTPFPDAQAEYENPSIVCSQDGLEWEVPTGLINPIMTPFDDTYDPNDYYHSDPDIIMSDDNLTMNVVWREHSNWRYETLRVVASTNGIDWSSQTELFSVDGHSTERVISPAIVRDEENFKMWTVNSKTSPRTIMMRSSENIGTGWSEPVATDIGLMTETTEIWHLDVIYYEGEYYMLGSVGMTGYGRGGTLFLGRSTNGINWEFSTEPVMTGVEGNWDQIIYRSTFIPYVVNNHLNFRVWYSSDGGTGSDSYTWRIGYTELIHEDTPFNSLPEELYITEVMYDNDSWDSSEFLDSYGEQEDWIELYNGSDSTIVLTHYYLTDDEDDLTKWEFPATSIAAGERLVVWCSGNDEQLVNGELHTNFKLSKGGESVQLVFVDMETIIDSVVDIAVPSDYSFGRTSFNFDYFNGLETPTPGTANSVQSGELSLAMREVMSNNNNFIVEDNLEFEDWIEIQNDSSIPVNTSYFYLSDEVDQNHKWQFPDYLLLPGERTLVWASGRDEANSDYIHTNFSVSASGEEVWLIGEDDVTYSSVLIPALNGDQSYAYVSGSWLVTNYPTPYMENITTPENVPNLIINEVLGSGSELFLDFNGEPSDWVEIYNPTESMINLEGMYLSDSWREYDQWQFPLFEIPAGDVRIIWCSGDDVTYDNGEIHTNFSISSFGEEVILVADDGLTIIDRFHPQAMDSDVSWGLYPNGSLIRYKYEQPTPGSLNPKYSLNDYSLVLNEVMASNDNLYLDADGDDGDWLELYNYGDSVIDLSGLFLSDNINELGLWEFPESEIAPNSYKIIWADKKDTLDVQGGLHTNFKLSSSEVLYISHVDSITVLDSLQCNTTLENSSIARSVDDLELIEEVVYPTPNNRNSLSGNLTDILYINELCSDNDTVNPDYSGEYEDWIEIYNSTDFAINLAQFSISDDEVEFDKWQFPNVTIGADEYLLVWCSSKDLVTIEGEIHTNFKVSSGGEPVTFTDINGRVIDNLPSVYIPEDQSYGRIADGSGNYTFFNPPTPNSANPSGGQPVLESAEASVEAGFYENGFMLELANLNGVGEIYYTLDSSIPDENSNLYEGAINIGSRMAEPNLLSLIRTTIPESSASYLAEKDYWEEPQGIVEKGTIIKARVISPGYQSSAVLTKSYFVAPGITERFDLSVFSITADVDSLFGGEAGIYVPGDGFLADPTDWHGSNYYNSGREWERPCHIEYFDGAEGLTMSREAGVRIHGGASRRRNRKSIRLYARDEYGGDMFDYQLFPNEPQDSFHKFVLRSSGQDSNKTNFRDAFIHTFVKHLEFDTMHYKPIVLFINGEYWGIHNIRNRLDEDYLNEVYGVEEDEIDLLMYSNGIVAEAGTTESFHALRNYVADNDLSIQENYEYVKTQMDVDNYIDYYITEIYAANIDWPFNNLRLWRKQTNNYDATAPAGHDGRWRWLLYDLDQSLGSYSGTVSANILHNSTTWLDNWQDSFRLLPRALLGDYPLNINNPNPKNGSPEFRNKFINKMADEFNSTFKPARALAHIQSLKSTIEPEMFNHTKRWNSPDNLDEWEVKVAGLTSFVQERCDYVREDVVEKFDFIDGISDVELDVSVLEGGTIQISTLLIDENTLGLDSEIAYPWNGVYFNGVEIPIKATAKNGYHFVSWSGYSTSTNDSISVVLSDDITLTAIFASDTEPYAELVINEIMSKNSSHTAPEFLDYDGDDSDWIELYNTGSITVELSEYYLSDDPDEVNAWQFTPYQLTPGERIVVWASSKNLLAPNGEMHTNFKLKASGEPIILTKISDMSQMDFVEAIAIPEDSSWGRVTDGAEEWQLFTTPTPNSTNASASLDTPQPTIIRIDGGVRISWNAVAGANGYKVFYSTNPEVDVDNDDFYQTENLFYDITNNQNATLFITVVATSDTQTRTIKQIRLIDNY